MKKRGFGPAEKQKNAKNHAFGPNLLKGCRAKYVENNVKLYRNKAKKSKAGAKNMQHSWKKRRMLAFWRKVAAWAEKMTKKRGFGPVDLGRKSKKKQKTCILTQSA